MRERMIFSIGSAGITWVCTFDAMKLDPYLTSYIKNNSKWMTDLSVCTNTRKHLEESTGINLCEHG
jgi:hypothetical protein